MIVDIGRLDKTMEFWNQLLTRLNAKGEDPDVLGISYYPEWHGSPEDLEFNLHTIATTYPAYELDVPETSYPASGGGGSPMPNSPYPRTIQGQADAIQRVFQIANDVVNNIGSGVLVWEPANWQTMFRAVPDMPNTWEPHDSINIFNRSHANHVLEDTVYGTALVGAALSLPSTVRVLTTADGTVGTVQVEWEAVPPGATDSPGEVTVVGATSLGEVTGVVDVIYDFDGFHPPLVNLPDRNREQAGRAVPVRFSLGGDHGLDVLAGPPKSRPVACDTGAPLAELEPVEIAEELAYDAATDTYKLVWKTHQSYAGTCRQLVVELDDDTQHRAAFAF